MQSWFLTLFDEEVIFSSILFIVHGVLRFVIIVNYGLEEKKAMIE